MTDSSRPGLSLERWRRLEALARAAEAQVLKTMVEAVQRGEPALFEAGRARAAKLRSAADRAFLQLKP